MTQNGNLQLNDCNDFTDATQLTWLSQDLPRGAVVLSTETELHRNLAGCLFPPFGGDVQVAMDTYAQISGAIASVCPSTFQRWLTPEAFQEDMALRRLLIIQHIEHAEFFAVNTPRRIIYTDAHDLFCIINGTDHLILKSMGFGLQPSELADRLLALESVLHEQLTFARTPYFGYLTSDAALCGTGFRLKAAVHLPGLLTLGHRKTMDNAAEELGFNIRHMSSNTQNDFQTSITFVSASNLPHCKPQEMAARLVDFIHRLEQHELDARKKLLQGHWSPLIIDKAKRALAILLNATLVRPGEAVEFLNDLWVADELGLLPLPIPHDCFFRELSHALNRYAVEIPRPLDMPFNLETDSRYAERIRRVLSAPDSPTDGSHAASTPL